MTTAVALLNLGTVSAAALSLAGTIRNPNPPAVVVAIASAFIFSGGLLVAAMKRTRVVLRGDEIEITSGLRRACRLTRTDVVGRRAHPAGWRDAPYQMLMTRSGTIVNLPPYLEHSQSLRDWLHNIPITR